MKMKTKGLKKAAGVLLSFALVLSLCMVPAPEKVKAAGTFNFTLNADKQEVHRGEEVNVTLDMSGNTEAYGVGYEVKYDSSKLELQSYKLGSATQDDEIVMKSIYSASAGQVKCGIMKATAPVKDGSIMELKFKVSENAAAGNVGFELKPDVVGEYAGRLDSENIDATDINVTIPATGISIKESTTIAKGSSEKLEAKLTPADSQSPVTWTSSNSSVATVAKDGTVTANAVGNAKITASADGHSAVCEVTVNNPLQSISITGEASTIKKGDTTQLTVIYTPEDTTDSKKVKWSSNAPDIAKVDAKGLVTAVADGEAVITAAAGDKTASYTITVKEVKLESIGIKGTTTIHRGEEETLTVTYNPADTTDSKNVKWSVSEQDSENPVVKVDGNGKVTALRIGEADVTATVGNFTATCKVTVDAPLKAIIADKPSLSMIKNQTAELKYSLEPEDTTDSKAVVFASSEPEVCSVDGNGTVTALRGGTAVITLSGANDVKAEVTVEVKEIPIDNVVLDKVNVTIEKGNTAELTASVNPGNTTDDDKTITWKSSDESVITVSPETTTSGMPAVITAAEKGGTATITATAWNGTKASCEVMVPIHLESISIPAEISLLRGKTTTPEVKYNPENTTDEKAVTWTSDNEAVASVDAQTGKITGLKEGTANITAATLDQKLTAKTKVTVTENHMTPEIGEKIVFEEIKNSILKGQSFDMNDALNLEDLIQKYSITDNIHIDWSADDTAVAAIDQNGVITGMKEGTTAVTAVITSVDAGGVQTGSYQVSADIRVKEIPLESIAFNKIITELKVGQTETLSIICNPADTTDVIKTEWTSSEPSVLSVENGKLTALKEGSAEITAKAGGKTVSCKITVKANDSGNAQDKIEGSNGGNNTVQTGDSSRAGLFGILLLASIAVFIFVCKKRIVK